MRYIYDTSEYNKYVNNKEKVLFDNGHGFKLTKAYRDTNKLFSEKGTETIRTDYATKKTDYYERGKIKRRIDKLQLKGEKIVYNLLYKNRKIANKPLKEMPRRYKLTARESISMTLLNLAKLVNPNVLRK